MKKNLTVLIMLTFISISSTFPQIPTSGLVAFYPFNGNANDSTGNGHNGTIYGATPTTDRYGNPNSAYSFDGNSWIEVPNSSQLDITGDKTISAWIYVPRADSASMLWYPTIITKNDIGSYYPTYGLYLSEYSGYYSNEFKYCFIMGDGSSNYQSFSNVDYPQYFDQWLCVVGVYYLKGGELKIYINGTLSHTLLITPLTASNSSTGDVCIGRNMDSGNAFFSGKIDEVAIYNRVLTATEVQQLCNEDYYVGINETSINNNDIIAYPNPNNGTFTLNFNANQPQQISVQVYDNIGKLIYSEQKNIDAGKQDLKLDLGNRSAGIYYYSLNFNGTKVYNKIAISH